MKIAIMGAGAVGGYFGARLAAAGEAVSFIARGRHLAAMREGGLRILSALGDVTVADAVASDDPSTLGPMDIVLFCVKLWDTDAAAERIKPLIGADTAVISLQNGVWAEQRLAKILGPEHVAGGTAQIAAAVAEPGVVRHLGTMAALEFAERDNRRTPRIEAFHAACRRAGIDATVPEDIEEAIWRKFVLLSSFSAATTLCRLPIGPIREDPPALSFALSLVAEAAAVGRGRGVRIADDLEDRIADFFRNAPANMQASMLGDLVRGARLELDWLSGAVVRFGEELGIPTPGHRVAWAALHPFADGPPRSV